MGNTVTQHKLGSLYFLTEKDLLGFFSPRYVKIGVVNESRSSEDRRSEHQGSNPRLLVVEDEIKTKVPEHTLEAFVHQRLAKYRVIREWFYYPEDGIKTYTDLAREINLSLESDLKINNKIIEYSSLEDNGKIIEASSDTTDILNELNNLENKLSLLKIKKNDIELQFKFLGGDYLNNIEGICYYEISKPSQGFDLKLFKEQYPVFAEELYIEKVKPRFSFTKIKSSKNISNSNKLKELENRCKKQVYKKEKLITLARNSKLELLHSSWLEFHGLMQPLILKKSQLENALKIATQDNAGIKDVCNWTRKISKSFTKKDVQKKYPEIYSKFLKPAKIRKTLKVNPFRPYKFL